MQLTLGLGGGGGVVVVGVLANTSACESHQERYANFSALLQLVSILSSQSRLAGRLTKAALMTSCEEITRNQQ